VYGIVEGYSDCGEEIDECVGWCLDGREGDRE